MTVLKVNSLYDNVDFPREKQFAVFNFSQEINRKQWGKTLKCPLSQLLRAKHSDSLHKSDSKRILIFSKQA